MKVNPVINCTLIIRSQVEYSAATQTVVLRCILERSALGERRGFTDVDALLVALRAELLELQKQIVPPERQNLKSAAASGSAPLTNAEPPTAPGSPGVPKDTTN